MRTMIKQAVEQPELMQEIQEAAAVNHDHGNPFVQDAANSLIVTWSIYMSSAHPEIPEDHHWATQHVRANACPYLRLRVS